MKLWEPRGSRRAPAEGRVCAMPLSAPVTACAVERSAGPLGRAACASMQGVRNNFEDAHILDQSLGICGVFDGHLGDEAAAFCAERLHLHIASVGFPPTAEALVAAFAACDAELKTSLLGSEAGSTATVALVGQNGSPESLKVYVASCGDSRALLWHKSSSHIEGTRDHRPSDPEERKRIEAAGGTVSDEFDPPRVDGQLACSRALGAFKFKQGPGGPAQQKVSCTPEVYQWSAKPGDWLLIGCDGVWDTFSSDRVVEEVCSKMAAEPSLDLGDTLVRTLQLCIDKEADDNLTLLAVELGSSAQAERVVSVLPGNFLKTKDQEVIDQYTGFCRRFGFLLQKEMNPKCPPAATLNPVEPMPALPRFHGLASLEMGQARSELDGGAGHQRSDPSASHPAPDEGMRPLVICGPSGVGKGTLISKLMDAFPDRFGFSVSHTTRQARPGEEDGKHYHFVELEQMKAQVEEPGMFIEHAWVHANLYGTSAAAVNHVKRQGRICILDIDIQGVKQIKELGMDANFLFILPPSMEALEKRLRGRATETEDKIQKRLANARGEIEFCEQNKQFGKTIVNVDLGAAVKQLMQLVYDWYPSLLMKMKISNRQHARFYISTARDKFAKISDEERAKPNHLEILATGSAIPSAVEVLAALRRDGHESILEETGLAEAVNSHERVVTIPRIRLIVRRSAASA